MPQNVKVILYDLKRRTQKKIALLGPKLMQLVYGLPSIELENLVRGDIQIDPPILEDTCLPPYWGPQDHDDFTPLMKIVKFFQPQIVLELGTAYGNMAANICRQCPNAKIYTVDTPIGKQTGIITTYQLTEKQIGRVYRRYGFVDRIVQVFENTLYLDLSQYFDEPIIDLAIIDACHDTEYVINDFLKVNPCVRKGGIVLLHDTHPSMENHLIGSYIACMLLRRTGYDIRHIKDTWWGIWIKSNQTSRAGR